MAVLIIAAHSIFAQMVGHLELPIPARSSSEQDDHTPKSSEFCSGYRGHSDGVNAHGHYGGADGLEFIPDVPVVSITTAKLVDDPTQPRILLEIVIRNLGSDPISIPWVPHPVEPGAMKQDGTEKTSGYEVLTIDFSLDSPFQQDPVLSLQRQVALYAQPGNSVQHLKLAHGQWAELEIEQNVVCRDFDSKGCRKRLYEKQKVSAFWYARTLETTYREGCIIASGAYTDSELKLGPTDISANFPKAR
ncbi:MAG TPA: hypothetical protein VKB38_11565 [Terracidiphilus sp.]|nr:hypothetical protein [Terracidiphilus sp.]